MGADSLVFRFLASLAASVGACDLDSTNHIHASAPDSGSVASIAMTQEQSKSHFGSGYNFLLISTAVAVEGAHCLNWPRS